MVRSTAANLAVFCLCASAAVAGQWTPIPFVVSNPETGPAVGMLAAGRNVVGPASDLKLLGILTWKRQSRFEVEFRRDSIGKGLWIIGGVLQGGLYPEEWRGLGSPAPDSLRVVIEPLFGSFELRAGRQSGNWKAMALWSGDLRTIDLPDTLSTSRARGLTARNGGTHLRGGIDLEYASLDHDDDPHRGTRIRLRAEMPLPGSSAYWSTLHAEAASYSRLFPVGPVAALRIRHEQSFGRPAFWNTPKLGSSSALRGSTQARVRGQAVQLAGLELRQPFRILRFHLQKAAFLEVGRAGGPVAIWTSRKVVPAGGLGGRLLLDDRHAVIRADLAISPQSSGLYLDFGQAF